MFRSFLSTLVKTILVVSTCVVMCLGCSRQEEVAVYEEPLADAPAATASGPRSGGSQREAVTAPPDEAIRYVVPEGWSPVEVSSFRRVTFQVQEGPLSVETTALGLPGTATLLLPNVNLWRKRVGLDHTTQEDLDAARE